MVENKMSGPTELFIIVVVLATLTPFAPLSVCLEVG
jgi:hypothetical protein